MRRLYYEDAYLAEFSAVVTAVRAAEDGCWAALDRTAFYPGGGGQPEDAGEIAGARVTAVREDADGRIWHRLEKPIGEGGVAARLDWARRFDLMQQHTGQHLLSAALSRKAGAETVGFHLTATNLQIDLDRPVEAEALAAAEEAANGVIWEDRPVVCRFLTAGEAEGISWRKPPPREGPVRLVSVEDFDASPCGGTHVRRTGEVGLIKITGVERLRGGMRVAFVCGGRALRDFRAKQAAVEALVRELHSPPGGLVQACRRRRERLDELEKELGRLKGLLLEREAEILTAGPGAVVAELSGRSAEELRSLAARIAGRGRLAVLAATAGGEARLALARPAGQGPDLAAALRRVLPLLGGKGGGTASFAEGSGRADRLGEALAALREELGG